MYRLLSPNITGGIASSHDHPWIVIIAYYTLSHLIEEAAVLTNADYHFISHDEQVDFMNRTRGLQDITPTYNQLDSLRKYALFRQQANVTERRESKIMGYSDPDRFKSVVLDRLFEPIKEKLTAYCKSLSHL
jgi:hypothetical protein